MKLSVTTELRYADIYADCGFQAIDISFCATIYPEERHDPILDGDDWKKKLDIQKEKFDRLGVVLNTTHLPYRYDYGKTDATDYDFPYRMTCRALEASDYLGAKWAVVHVASVEETVKHIRKLFADTKVKSVGIAIENMIDLPIENVIESYEILKAEGYRVGVCFDFGHCHIHKSNNYEVPEIIRLLGSRIQMLHVHDNCRNGDQHRVPYAGTIPWRKSMAALKEAGYTGDFNYELNINVVPEPVKQAYVKYSKEMADYLIAAFNAYDPSQKEETK